MKTNKEFGSPRNEGNETTKNEINEVLREENEGQHNKILHIKREELIDNNKKNKLRQSFGILYERK